MEVTVVGEAWKPQWAGAHIEASYTPLVRNAENPTEVDEAQHVYCRCGHCGGVFKADCERGLARNHIQTFCVTHNRCPAPTVKP